MTATEIEEKSTNQKSCDDNGVGITNLRLEKGAEVDYSLWHEGDLPGLRLLS